MASLFVSYSRRDIEVARKLTEAFKGQDLDFWIDWEGIPPTVDWWQEIQKGIEEADVFVFLLSPDSASSKVCKQEVEHAIKNGKRLIPVVVRDMTGQQVPVELSSLNWIFFRPGDDFDASLKKLMTAIKTDYGWVQAHRQLQLKALEWQRNNQENSFLLRGKELQEAESQLAVNSSKEPFPTDLQREYVLKSRQVADRQRRITTAISAAGLIILALLAIYAFRQAGLATQQASIAQTAQASSESEANARATAQANAETNQKLAETRAKIARAGELAAIAINQLTVDQERSLLLALAANDSAHTLEANDALRRALQAFPLHSVIERCPKSRNEEDPVLYLQYAFSDDGTKLAIFCNVSRNENLPREIRIIDIASGDVLLRIPIEDNLMFAYNFAFSSDGSSFVYIARGEGGGSLAGSGVVWNIPAGQEVFVTPEMGTGGELNQDGTRLWFYNPDAYIDNVSGPFVFVYDVNNQKAIAQLPLSQLGSRRGANQIAVLSDVSLAIYDMTTLAKKDLQITPQQQVIALNDGSEASEIRVGIIEEKNFSLVDFSTGQRLVSIPVGDSEPASVSIAPDGSQVALVFDNRIELRSLLDPGAVLVLTGHEGPIGRVRYSQDSKFLISTSLDTTCRIWDTQTGKLRSIINKVVSADLSPDKQFLMIQTEDRNLLEWDFSNTGELASLYVGKPVNSVGFSKDDQLISITTQNGDQVLWKWTQPGDDNRTELPQTTTTPRAPHTWDLLSPDGKFRVTIDNGNDMQVFNAETNQLLLQTRVTSDQINDVRFSPDSSKLILAFGSPFVSQAMGDIGWLPFRTPGELDHTVTIWDLQTLEKAAILRGFSDAVNEAIFSHDSKYIATASSDGYVRVYLANIEDLVTLAKQRIIRVPPELTCEERVQFLDETTACPSATPAN